MYATAFLDIPPLQHASGEVTLPGSKSISNRVLLLAALCSGTTTVHDLLDSDDTRVMLQALRDLGCGVEGSNGQPLRITGLAAQLPVKTGDLFLGNAGTAMRPLTAALALLASVHGGSFGLRGIARMHERPIGDLVDALQQLGCPVSYTDNTGYPPLQIGNGQVTQLDLAQPIRVRGDVSSQFLTALLLALPLVAQHQAIHIDVVGELISKPYIEITLNLLARFGVNVQRDGWQRFTIAAGSAYRSPGNIHVEGDASSASYFIALGAIASGEGGQKSIKINGVGAQSIQGDIRFAEAAAAMGARITMLAQSLGVRQSKLEEVPSIALGTSLVSLKEMVNAYASIAHQGRYLEPVLVTRIEDRQGHVIEDITPTKPENALPERVAYTLIDTLRGVVDRGTGTDIRNRWGIRADVAGKTGTTQDNTDGWFILMQPQLVAGAWVGFNDSRITLRSDYWGQGAHSALPMVGEVFQQALRQRVIDGNQRFIDENESNWVGSTVAGVRNWVYDLFGRRTGGPDGPDTAPTPPPPARPSC